MGINEKQSRSTLEVEGIYAKGFGVISKAIMLDLDLSIEAKAIYSYFCSLAGNGATAFPSRDTILSHLKISKDYYYKHFKQLMEQGSIRVDRVGKFPCKNIYTLVNNPKKYVDKEMAYNKLEGQIKYRGLKAYGFGTIPRCVMLDERLDIKAKGIYSYLCSYAGSGVAAFPGVDKILYHLGIGQQAYRKYCNQLISCNYITVMQRRAERGNFSVNDYYLNENPGSPGGRPKQVLRKVPPRVDIQDNAKTVGVSSSMPRREMQDNASPRVDIQDNASQYHAPQDTNINSITINSIKYKQQHPRKRVDDVSLDSTEKPVHKSIASFPEHVISLIDKYNNITGLDNLRPLFLVKLMKELDVGDSYVLEKLRILELNLKIVEKPLQFFISAMKNDWAQAQAKIKTDVGKGASKDCPDCMGEGWIVTETSARECVCKKSAKKVEMGG